MIVTFLFHGRQYQVDTSVPADALARRMAALEEASEGVRGRHPSADRVDLLVYTIVGLLERIDALERGRAKERERVAAAAARVDRLTAKLERALREVDKPHTPI